MWTKKYNVQVHLWHRTQNTRTTHAKPKISAQKTLQKTFQAHNKTTCSMRQTLAFLSFYVIHSSASFPSSFVFMCSALYGTKSHEKLFPCCLCSLCVCAAVYATRWSCQRLNVHEFKFIGTSNVVIVLLVRIGKDGNDDGGEHFFFYAIKCRCVGAYLAGSGKR